MDWLPGLLNYFTVRWSALVAVFLTATLLTIGPAYAPNVLAPLQPEYRPWVVAAGAFSGSLLLISALSFTAGSIKRLALKCWRRSKNRKLQGILVHELGELFVKGRDGLSPFDRSLLWAAAQDPAEAYDIGKFNYEAIPISKVFIYHSLEQLQDKGLVELDKTSADLVRATRAGRAIIVNEEFPVMADYRITR